MGRWPRASSLGHTHSHCLSSLWGSPTPHLQECWAENVMCLSTEDRLGLKLGPFIWALRQESPGFKSYFCHLLAVTAGTRLSFEPLRNAIELAFQTGVKLKGLGTGVQRCIGVHGFPGQALFYRLFLSIAQVSLAVYQFSSVAEDGETRCLVSRLGLSCGGGSLGHSPAPNRQQLPSLSRHFSSLSSCPTPDYLQSNRSKLLRQTLLAPTASLQQREARQKIRQAL